MSGFSWGGVIMPAVRIATRSYLLMLIAILAGCHPAPAPIARGGSIRFEVTDLSKPREVSTVTAQNGAVIDYSTLFAVRVRVIGTGVPGARALRVRTTAYTPYCYQYSVPKPYRTKRIVFPDGVASAFGQYGLVQDWPLSSDTLIRLAVCQDAARPWYPWPWREAPPALILMRAQVQDANGTWTESDLTIRISRPRYADRSESSGKSVL